MNVLIAAVAFVAAHSASKTTACGGTGTACVLTLGFTASVGNDVMVTVATDSTCSVSTVTDSSGTNTYAIQGAASTNATCAEKNSIYGSHLGATATTVTVSYTGSCSSQFTQITATEYSGVLAYGNTNSATGNSTTTSVAVVLQDAANVSFGGFHVCVNSGTYTATAGTIRKQGNGTTEGTACSIDNTTGTVTATSSTGQWNANAVELCAANPCAAAAGGPAESGMRGFWGLGPRLEEQWLALW